MPAPKYYLCWSIRAILLRRDIFFSLNHISTREPHRLPTLELLLYQAKQVLSRMNPILRLGQMIAYLSEY